MVGGRRVDISLLDSSLRDLINASSKIFPITESDVINNNNPNNYEYGRVGKSIYIWYGGKWEYIIADDIDISWLDIKNKPLTFTPSEHTHSELHSHDNKSAIDLITKPLFDSWNTIVDKVDKTYVDTKLDGKSNVAHRHDLDYAKKSVEVTVVDLNERLYNIENGYTEGHSHPNVDILNSITQVMVNDWNTISDKANLTYVDNQLITKVNVSTFNGHINNSNIHVTQIDKDSWNNKANNVMLEVYSKNAVDLPLTYPMGISVVFVSANEGWFNYGTVMTIRGYSGGGGTYQVYTPYGVILGGKHQKIRYSDYGINAGNSWVEWKDVGDEPVIGTVKPTSGSMWYKVIG